jgi:hypothetical protein
MILCRANNLLARGHWEELRASALQQTFQSKDTSQGRVSRGSMRNGTEVCFEWDGFDSFWTIAAPTMLEWGKILWPEAMTERRIKHCELTKMSDGGRFASHTDQPYGNPTAPVVSFVYYLGDKSTFTGGELRHRGMLIQPDDNSLCMYRGTEPHAVLPIMGENAMRLTINGYFSAWSQ